MYAELIFNYLIGEQCPDIELPSPVEQSQILGQSKKFLFSELQSGDMFKWKQEKLKKNLSVGGYVYYVISPQHSTTLPQKRRVKPNKKYTEDHYF